MPKAAYSELEPSKAGDEVRELGDHGIIIICIVESDTKNLRVTVSPNMANTNETTMILIQRTFDEIPYDSRHLNNSAARYTPV